MLLNFFGYVRVRLVFGSVFVDVVTSLSYANEVQWEKYTVERNSCYCKNLDKAAHTFSCSCCDFGCCCEDVLEKLVNAFGSFIDQLARLGYQFASLVKEL